ncbi:MAG: FixH family protein [Candidatus Tectimicrobiota bacterium]
MHAPYTARTARLLGALAWSGLLLTGSLVHGQAQQPTHDHGSHQHGAAVCRGFVVLPNGFAVLSGQTAAPEHGKGSPAASGAGHGTGAMADKSHAATGTAPHLLGYTHGQAIVPTAEMLCVPMGGAGSQTWKAIGPHDAPLVTVASLKGALTGKNRTNAAFDLQLQQDGKPVEAAQVRVLARMPHHDRRMQGGHGPANDPDVKGVEAEATGPGRYAVPLIDFTMSGPWLFEIQVQRGASMQKVYVAPTVADE